MQTAVQQAIQSRIDALDAEIHNTTQILTGYVTAMNDAKTLMDSTAHTLHVLELERDELASALPADEPTDPEPIEDDEPDEEPEP